MKIHVLTVFPEIIQTFFDVEFRNNHLNTNFCENINFQNEKNIAKGVVSTAIEKRIFNLNLVSLRKFSSNKYKSVDDRPFGGGDGMVLEADVLAKGFNSLNLAPESKTKVVYLSPQGSVWNQKKAQIYSSSLDELVLVCGRYGGVDQRFLNSFVDEEISVGDYVLSGGELAAAILIDSIARCLPGTLKNMDSYKEDSFQGGHADANLLEAPIFTRPLEVLEQKVPEILLSGDHGKIKEWKKHIGLLITLMKRPDLINFEKQQSEIDKAIQFAKNMSESEKKVLGLDKLNFKE